MQGGNESFEKTAKGGKSARATLLEVKAAALAMISRRSGWEGWTQWGFMGSIAAGGWSGVDVWSIGGLSVEGKWCVV